MRVVNGPDVKALINKAFAEALVTLCPSIAASGHFGLSAQAAPLTSGLP